MDRSGVKAGTRDTMPLWPFEMINLYHTLEDKEETPDEKRNKSRKRPTDALSV